MRFHRPRGYLCSPPSMEELSSTRCYGFPGALTELRFAYILSMSSKDAYAGGFLLRVVTPSHRTVTRRGSTGGCLTVSVCPKRPGYCPQSSGKGLV